MAQSHGSPAPEAEIPPLAGYSVLIASDQRRDPVAPLLERAGARTASVQAARSVSKPDDAALWEATAQCLNGRCHEVVVSSAVGMRAWATAARRWGLLRPLLARFAQARLLARDDAAADSLRNLGLGQILSTDAGTAEELLRYLLAQPQSGRRIVVQTARQSLAEPCAALRAAGAEVIEAPTFVAAPPAESYSVRRLCDLVTRRQVDALVLAGGAVAEQVWSQARRQEWLTPLVRALEHDVLCLSLGQLPTGAPVRPLVPSHPFGEELVDTLRETLPPRALTVTAAGRRLELRGHAVVLDGQLVPVQAGPLAVLRALARRPGEVLSSAELRAAIGHHPEVDDHAVEMAVSRLRQTFHGADLVQTIVKHGYTLAR